MTTEPISTCGACRASVRHGNYSPPRDQFIVKREQVDLLLDEIIPRMEEGVHHDKEGFLEVLYYIERFNAYKGGSRGKYTLNYFENLWDMEYTPE